MNQLTTSRSKSPKHERIKHKSEEDLSQLRSRNEAAEAEKQRLAMTSRSPKPSQHSIDGDAKLVSIILRYFCHIIHLYLYHPYS